MNPRKNRQRKSRIIKRKIVSLRRWVKTCDRIRLKAAIKQLKCMIAVQTQSWDAEQKGNADEYQQACSWLMMQLKQQQLDASQEIQQLKRRI